MKEKAVTKTERWLNDWVIALNLCPFAKHPYQQGRVRIAATAAIDSDQVFSFVLDELELLHRTPASQLETTLVVIEHFLQDFQDYLDFLSLLESVISQSGLEGEIQIASFHPDYCFEGESKQDPANYTNRSPYPMFHLIREASLEKAIAHYPDPENIPGRNIRLLRDMGQEKIRQKLAKSIDEM